MEIVLSYPLECLEDTWLLLLESWYDFKAILAVEILNNKNFIFQEYDLQLRLKNCLS